MILWSHRHLFNKKSKAPEKHTIQLKQSARVGTPFSKACLANEARPTAWRPLSVCVWRKKKRIRKRKEKSSSSRVAPYRRAKLRSSEGATCHRPERHLPIPTWKRNWTEGDPRVRVGSVALEAAILDSTGGDPPTRGTPQNQI